MSFEFTESVSLEVPRIEPRLKEFREGRFSSEHSLIAEFAAIHKGMTKNFNNYSQEELESSIPSWTKPYPKPILRNHDRESEPLGRVIGASMETEHGRPFSKIQAAILDPEAVVKLLDGRYLTGSVGAKADEALCSICNADWAKRMSLFDVPCEHEKGQEYEGKLAYFNLRGVGFNEYSLVNIPADEDSRALKLSLSGTQEAVDLVPTEEKPYLSKFYALNVAKPEVLYLSESEETNILPMMKPADAADLYSGLRAAFSGLKVQEAETIVTDEQTPAEDVAAEEQEDDVLSAVESLKVEDSEEIPAEETPEEEETPAEEATPEDAVEEEPAPEVEPAAEENAELNDIKAQLEAANTELGYAKQALEDTQAQLEKATTENIRLRQALLETLANRVVDLKISIGLGKESERQEMLAEHVKRSSQSLADSIKDLLAYSKTNRRTTATEMPTVHSPVDTDPVVTQEEAEPEDAVQELSVIYKEALLGKRQL